MASDAVLETPSNEGCPDGIFANPNRKGDNFESIINNVRLFDELFHSFKRGYDVKK